MESDLGCSSRIYYDVTLTLHNVTLTSQKPCKHNNKCDCSKTNGYKWSWCFFQQKIAKIYFVEKSSTSFILLIKLFRQSKSKLDWTQMLQYYFFLRQFRLIKWSFYIHSTTPYIHPRLDSRIEPKFSDCHLNVYSRGKMDKLCNLYFYTFCADNPFKPSGISHS